MSLPLDLLRVIQGASSADAWKAIIDHVWAICSTSLDSATAHQEVPRRDRAVGDVDLFMATAGWDLWKDYEASVPRCADMLAHWWGSRPKGRAVLILDALSLREVPWLLQEGALRGFTIHEARPGCAELPADTSPFAKALGFSQRSALQNNSAGNAHRFQGAVTETLDLPWKEAAAHITSAPDWLLWHQWPDTRLHELSVPGHGVVQLAREVATQLASDDFWDLVRRLTNGRRLVITSDHGYAASGLFQDASDEKQALHLKERFKSGRSAPALAEAGTWVPPIDLVLNTHHGLNAFALGRRKWKSQGGYPTLTHGGLSLLEVIVPFIEISRPAEV